MEILPEEDIVSIQERPPYHPSWIKAVYDLVGGSPTTVTFFKQGGVSITTPSGSVYLRDSQYWALRMLFKKDI